VIGVDANSCGWKDGAGTELYLAKPALLEKKAGKEPVMVPFSHLYPKLKAPATLKTRAVLKGGWNDPPCTCYFVSEVSCLLYLLRVQNLSCTLRLL